MSETKIKTITTLALGSIILTVGILNAQIEKDSDLFKTLKMNDSLLFNVGFNACNIDQFKKMTHDDFEFYHDKNGVVVSKEAFVSSIINGPCQSDKPMTRRQLDDSTLQVYPLHDQGVLYGAIQMGIHHFGNVSANFTHVWQLENGEWKISRVLSYNHHEEISKAEGNVEFIEVSSELLNTYVGKYKFSPEFTLNVTKEGNGLLGESGGISAEIKPYATHKFATTDNKIKIEFRLDDANVVGMTMINGNAEMHASKME